MHNKITRFSKKTRNKIYSIFRRTRSRSDMATRPQFFSYRIPDKSDAIKQIVLMAKSPRLQSSMLVLGAEYEESLHSHDHVDGFWMVLNGQVAFYGADDIELGKFGPMEGVFIPRVTQYWFKVISPEGAEVLQVLRFEPKRGWDRKELGTPAAGEKIIKRFDARSRAVD